MAPGEGAWVSAADRHSLVWDVSLQPVSCVVQEGCERGAESSEDA